MASDVHITPVASCFNSNTYSVILLSLVSLVDHEIQSICGLQKTGQSIKTRKKKVNRAQRFNFRSILWKPFIFSWYFWYMKSTGGNIKPSQVSMWDSQSSNCSSGFEFRPDLFLDLFHAWHSYSNSICGLSLIEFGKLNQTPNFVWVWSLNQSNWMELNPSY